MHMFWSLGDSGILSPPMPNEAEELAEKLCETVTVLRRMIADYFRHCGTIDKVTNAVEAFVAAPTGPNQRQLESRALHWPAIRFRYLMR